MGMQLGMGTDAGPESRQTAHVWSFSKNLWRQNIQRHEHSSKDV
jgi:hypothetical protein